MHSKTSRKVLDTWFRLKVLFDNGYFKYSTKSLKELEDDCGVTYKTILKRLRIAQSMRLVRLSEGTAYLAPYSQLQKTFGCVFTRHYYIKWDLLEHSSIEDLLDAKAIEEKQLECKQAYYFKINKFQAKEDLKRVIPEGYERSFTQGATMAHLVDFLEGGDTENSWLFKIGRADFQVGHNRLTELYGYSSRGSLTYKKRKLQKLGLITVNKRTVEFDRGKHSTRQKRSTDLGTVNYRRFDGKLQLTLPDEIIVHSQAQILSA